MGNNTFNTLDGFNSLHDQTNRNCLDLSPTRLLPWIALKTKKLSYHACLVTHAAILRRTMQSIHEPMQSRGRQADTRLLIHLWVEQAEILHIITLMLSKKTL